MAEDIAKPSKASRWQVLAHGQRNDDGIARCPAGHIHLDYENVSLRFQEQEFLMFAEMVRAAAASLRGEPAFTVVPPVHKPYATFSRN